MEEIMKRVRNFFIGKPFTKNTADEVKRAIELELKERYHGIENDVFVVREEIHVSERLLKINKDIIYYLPYIADIKTGYFYDLYAGEVPVFQIAYNENIDPVYYGYIAEIRPINGGKIKIKIDIEYDKELVEKVLEEN
jgi:hypothetical protein